MSTLLLVRHGQASFLEPEYDRLSPLGEEQARRLGDHLVDERLRPTAWVTGPRERQRRTAELAAERLRDAGVPVPELVVLPELDEHQGGELLRAHLPRLASAHAPIADLARAFAKTEARSERGKIADKLLREALRLWASGDPSTAGIESFVAVRARAARALELVTAGDGHGRCVVAFTSGGLVGAAAAAVLRADDLAALDLGFVTRNAAFCEILFSGERRSLSQLNARPHLTRDQATYR